MTQRIPFSWLLIFLLSFLLLTSGGRIAPLDEETTFRMTVNLIERGQLKLTQQPFTVEPQAYAGFLPLREPRTQDTTWTGLGLAGERFPIYTHAQPLLQIPLYLLSRLVGSASNNLAGVALMRFAVSLLNPIVIALTGWLLALLGKCWGFSNRLSVALGLSYPLGTMALAYTHTNFSDPLLALWFTLAAYAAYRAHEDHHLRWLILTGVALSLALYLRERALIVMPLYLAYLLFTRRATAWRDWAAFLSPIGLGGLALAVWNMARFGSPVAIGYANWVADTGFEAPILLGLYGLVMSPGKGLLLYNPIAWIGAIGLITMPQRRRAEGLWFGGMVLVSLFFYASYNFWTGGWNWGPRYMLSLLPFLILSAADWVHAHPTKLRRALFVGLSVLTLLLNLPAVLVDHSRYLVSFGERDPQHYLDRSTLRMNESPLVQQWPVVFELTALYARPETWAAAQQAVQDHLQRYDGATDFESLSTHLIWVDEYFRLNMPDFWFVHLPMLGFAPVGVGLFALTLLVLAVFSGWKLIQMLR